MPSLVNKISGLYRGDKAEAFEGIPSMIDAKRACTRLVVGELGVEGDGQADPKHHGGATVCCTIFLANIMVSIVAGT